MPAATTHKVATHYPPKSRQNIKYSVAMRLPWPGDDDTALHTDMHLDNDIQTTIGTDIETINNNKDLHHRWRFNKAACMSASMCACVLPDGEAGARGGEVDQHNDDHEVRECDRVILQRCR